MTQEELGRRIKYNNNNNNNNNNNIFACYKLYNFTHCLQIPRKKNNNKIKRYK
jgi:hypothetical protein